MNHARRSFLCVLPAAATLLTAGAAFASWDKGEAVTLPPLTLLDGKPLNNATLQGKVVVVEFWASWCPFCAKQNPLIEALYRDNKSRGLEVVAVSIDKTHKAAAGYMRRHGYTFQAGMLNPAYEAIYKLRKGLPQTYVIGRDGRIVQIEMGEMFEEDIKAIARHL